MSLIFKYTNSDSEFYRSPITIKDFDSKSAIIREDLLAFQSEKLSFKNWCIDGFRMAHSSLVQSNTISYTVQNNLDVVKVYFNTKGSSEIRYHQIADKFNVKEGFYNMLYSPRLSTTMSHAGTISEIFSLQVTKELFLSILPTSTGAVSRFANDVAAGRPSLLSPFWLPIDYRIANCIRDVIHCPFIRNLKDLYLRAKAMELFALVLDANPANERSPLVKDPTDHEKIKFAKEYILENYASSISLSSLSRKCGLNEFKLKNGFREFFGQSVIDYLIDQRLQQAKNLLLRKTHTVTEVSYEVGYTSPQYFARAFRKKFGMSPSEVK